MKKNLLSILTSLIVIAGSAQVTLTLQPDACSGKDAYMGDIQGNQNFGNDDDFASVAWTCGGNPCIARSLLQFDLSGVPPGSTITSASLSLYANLTSTNGNAGNPMWGSNNASYLNRVTASWSEMGVTWNMQPASTTTDQVLLPQSTSTTQDYVNVDITTFCQYWNQNPTQNYGMLLGMTNPTPLSSLLFCSSDHTDSTRRPKLEICFSLPTSVTENNTQSVLKVYPNPATDLLTVSTGELRTELVSIYNVDGKLVSETKHLTNNSIDVSHLPKGIYIAELKTKDGIERVRWVKL